MWRRLWNGWKLIAHRIGAFQSRLLLSVFYFIAMAPFALIARLGPDRLRRRRVAGSTWIERAPRPDDLDAARRQY